MWVQLYLKKQFIFLTKAVTIAVQSNSGPQRSEPTTRKLEIQINPGTTKILGLPKNGGEPKMSPLNHNINQKSKSTYKIKLACWNIRRGLVKRELEIKNILQA